MKTKILYQEAKEKISEAAKPFGGYISSSQCGKKRDGRKTIKIDGLVCKKLGIECAEIPQPMIDRIMEVLDSTDVTYEDLKDEKLTVYRQGKKERIKLYPRKIHATNLILRYNILNNHVERSKWMQHGAQKQLPFGEITQHSRFAEWMDAVYGMITVLWCVTIVLPVEMSVSDEQIMRAVSNEDGTFSHYETI